jgi:hypothetical protein
MEEIFKICDREVKVRGRALRVARIEGDNYRFLDDPQPMISALENCGKRIDLFTFMQRLPETAPKFKYPMEWDNVAALPVTTFENWWTGTLNFKGRNKAKQAEKKGVELREVPFGDELIEGIWRIYNENPIRQGKRFHHFGMSLEKVREHAGTFLDCSIFVGAFLAGELIGFAKLTMDESSTQAGLMHILSMIKHREKSPTNALIVQAVRSCAERKIAYLVYSQFSYGNKQKDSLSDFKERNGFQRIDIPRYYVPLTRLGEIAFRAGMHRSLIERLPEPLITKLRGYRAAWYSRSMPTKSEAR